MISTLPIMTWPETNCNETNYYLFDAEDDDDQDDLVEKYHYPYLEEALALCATCPARVLCAQAGRGETHGIWGGVPK